MAIPASERQSMLPYRLADAPVVGTSQSQLEKSVAVIVLVLLGMRFTVGSGTLASISVGGACALVLMPAWLGSMRYFWGARLFMTISLLALISGIFLGVWSSTDHRIISGTGIDAAGLLVETICGIGVVIWSRRLLSPRQIGLAYGIGMMLAIGISRNATFTSNPWKYGWAVATAVVVLSLVCRPQRRLAEFTLLAVLGAISILLSSRSYFGTFMLSAILIMWQIRPKLLSRRASWAWTAALFSGLGAAIYYLGTTLLVGGYLGQAAQQKSIQQLDASGSLILGGRPELAATIALFRHHIMGFGLGVVANTSDVNVAKAGLAAIHYDPNNGYVERFMFGNSIELHSTSGDIWAYYGLIGLALVLVIAFLIIRGLAAATAERSASALLLFLCWWTLWNLMFSPLLSAAPTLVLALGLAVTPRHTRQSPIPSPAQDAASDRGRAPESGQVGGSNAVPVTSRQPRFADPGG